jgi:hypothetical protein
VKAQVQPPAAPLIATPDPPSVLGPRSSVLRSPASRWRTLAAHTLAVVACAVTLAEFATGTVAAVPVERDDATLAGYQWLAQQPRGLVIEFPADSIRRGSVETTTRYMYYSTYHWQPHVQGYSGFVPPLHYELLAEFPDDRSTATPSHLNAGNVGVLRDLGVRYILFHRFRYSGGGWRLVQENLATIEGLTLAGQFGPTWIYLLESGGRQPVRAEVLLPNRAVTGATYLAHFALQNANPTRAAFGFGGKASLTVTWRDEAGRTAGSASASVQPGTILGQGTRLVPVELGAAPAPGDYRLTVASTDARLAPLLPTSPIAVTVLPAAGGTAGSGQPPHLARLAWPEQTYQPGEVIPVALTWVAAGALPGHTVFFQLIGPDNKVWGQRDGDPLDTRRPAGDWLPGEAVHDRRDLPIKPEAPPGRYRILVGLYNPATGQRLPILGPDASTPAPEVWSTAITVGPRP